MHKLRHKYTKIISYPALFRNIDKNYLAGIMLSEAIRITYAVKTQLTT